MAGNPKSESFEACVACGGNFARIEGPAHAYMHSSPGCWAAYGELLVREYENAGLFGAAHQFTVDAYALQHPGKASDRRAVQSVWVHFVSCYLALEKKSPASEIIQARQKLAGMTFPPLPPHPTRFEITLADVLAAPESRHLELVRLWAASSQEAWSALKTPAIDMLSRL